jgi:hypothetical protein
MGEFSCAHLGLRHRSAPQRFDGSASHFTGTQQSLMRTDGFFNLRANTHDRVERRHRLLKHHRDFAAAHFPPLVLSKRN